MKPTLDRSHLPVVVATFFPEITREEAVLHFREIGELAAEHGKIAVVVDLTRTNAVTLALKRSAASSMQSLFRSSGAHIVAVAHVVHSHAARMLLGALQTLAPPPFPSCTTSSLEEALRWARRWLARSQGIKKEHGQRALPDEAHVASGLVSTLVKAAKARGLDVDTVLTKSGLPLDQVDDVDARLPYGSLMCVVETLSESASDPFFGLRVAEKYVDAGSFGAVGFAARSSSSLREAIERTARYARLINENTEITVHFEAAGARIVDGPIAPLVWPRQYAEMALASFVVLGRKWTGVPFDAVSVGFRHGAPSDRSEHVRIFGCEPSFDCTENYVVIPTSVLDHPLEHGDPQLGRYFDSRLNDLAQNLASAPGPLADLRDAVAHMLTDGAPTVSAVAKALGASERTLQRRLASRGLTFSAVLDGVRREVALRAAERSTISVQELAARSGFADLKAFRRAFRRWTGQSPRNYRNQDR